MRTTWNRTHTWQHAPDPMRRRTASADVTAHLAATITGEEVPVRYAIGGECVAVGSEDGIRVYDLSSLHSPPLLLPCDEPSPVLALAPGGAPSQDSVTPVTLAAAGPNTATVWVLRRKPGVAKDLVIGAAPKVEGTPMTFEFALNHELATSPWLGEATRSIVFEAGARRFALLVGAETWIWEIRRTSLRLTLRLIGDAAPLSACVFGRLPAVLSHDVPPILLSACEDRCFKLWRLPLSTAVSAGSGAESPPSSPTGPTSPSELVAEDAPVATLLLQSALPPGGALLLCAALHPLMPQLVLGDSSGVVHVYELYRGERPGAVGCRGTHRVDFARIAHTRALSERAAAALPRPPSTPPAAVLDSRPRWQQPLAADQRSDTTAAEDAALEAAELSGTLLALGYVRLPHQRAEEALLPPGAADADADASAYGVLASVPGAPLLLRVGRWEAAPVPLHGETADGAPADEVAGSSVVLGDGVGTEVQALLGGGVGGLMHMGAATRKVIAKEVGGGEAVVSSVGWMARASSFQPRLRVWWLQAEEDERRGLSGEGADTAGRAADAPLACLNCGDPRHYNWECPEPRRSPPPEDDEYALNYAEGDGIDGEESGFDGQPSLSVLPTRPPLPASPLARALAAAELAVAPAATPRPSASGAKSGGAKVGAAPVPATFHRKIASSGYGKAPIMKLHAGGPSTLAARAAAANATAPLGRGGGGVLGRKYTPAEGPICHLQTENSSAPRPIDAAAMRLAFAPDASRLAIAAADGAVSLLKLPARRHAQAQGDPSLPGHTAALTSVHWSHSGRLLLSASADGSACLWDAAADKPPTTPLLRLDHVAHPPRLSAPQTAGEALNNPKFGGEVRGARFFYLDRFLLLAAENSLHLYSYTLGPKTPSHEATRAAELRHTFRLQHRWPMRRAHHVTCFAAANSFLSPLALLAGSDRSIAVVDLGTGQLALDLPEAHERPVHALRLHEGSAHGDTPTAGHDLFLSCAVDGAVKLWDLRSASCVRRFSAHVNRLHPIGACLSPCLRYVATGSEDRSCYLYDARSGSLLERLRHSDTVLDAAFSPLHPQLAACALDGTVRFYSDRPERDSVA